MTTDKPPQQTNNETLQNNMTDILERPFTEEIDFDDLVVDEQSHEHVDKREFQEQTLAELEAKMDRWQHDPAFRGLIESVARDRGVDITDQDMDDLDGFRQGAQRAFDFRNGAGRDSVKATDISDESRQYLYAVKDELAMDKTTNPVKPKAKVMFVPGSAGIIPLKRLESGEDRREKGLIDTNVVVLIGSERPVDLKQNAAGQNELDRAGPSAYSKNGVPAKTEFDIDRNAAAHVYNIPDEKWQYWSGIDSRVPDQEGFQREWKIAYYEDEENDFHVFVLSAPMLGGDRYQPNGSPRNRSNTSDGYIMAAEMFRDEDPDSEIHTITVTDAGFKEFQEADAKASLAVFGISNETVGHTREHVGLKEWPAGDAFYLQETLSALRQTYAGIQYLRRQLGHDQAA